MLFVRITANVLIPAYSEMEILADTSDSIQEDLTYILKGVESQPSNVMVARAVVTPGMSVPVRVMNPTDQLVTLYRGAKIAYLSEVEEVSDDSMLVSGKHTSTELEAALWTLAEQASLEPEEQEKLFILLMEYADVFALSNDTLGRTDVLQHEIHTGNTPPIRQHFRRVCPKKRQEMKILLSEMLEK